MLVGHSDKVTSLAFSHNSKLVASASDDHTVKIWDMETGVEIRTLKGHSDGVTSVAFSHDSKLVASASYGDIKIWGVETTRETTSDEVYTREIPRWVFPLDIISFRASSSHLITNIGYIGLGHSSYPFTSTPALGGSFQTPQAETQSLMLGAHCDGYSLTPESSVGQWISWNGSPALWLPPDYQPLCSAVSRMKVVVGCGSGRVVILRFSGAPRLI